MRPDTSTRHRIVTWSIAGGLLTLVVGFVAPLYLFPGSNLGPLLGIFGAPIGAAVAAVAAVAFSLRRAAAGEEAAALAWLLRIDVLAIALGCWAAGLAPQLAFPALGVQALCVLVGAAQWRRMAARGAPGAERSWQVGLATGAATAVLLLSLVPPARDASGFTLVPLWDSRFDTSHHVALATIERGWLALEMGIVLVIVLVIALLAERRRRPGGVVQS